MKMHTEEAGKRSEEKTNTDQKFTRSEMYREVLYVIAWITLGQGLCFIGAAMFQNDVSVLPDDPFTLIGSLYIAMGIGFILISKLCGGKSSKSDTYTSCKLETMAVDSSEINQMTEDKKGRQFKELRTEDNKEMGFQKSTEIEDISRKLENVTNVAESQNQQWDMVDSFGDVLMADKELDRIKEHKEGCDKAVIPTSE